MKLLEQIRILERLNAQAWLRLDSETEKQFWSSVEIRNLLEIIHQCGLGIITASLHGLTEEAELKAMKPKLERVN